MAFHINFVSGVGEKEIQNMNDTEKTKAFYREFGAQFPRLEKVEQIVSNSIYKYSFISSPRVFLIYLKILNASASSYGIERMFPKISQTITPVSHKILAKTVYEKSVMRHASSFFKIIDNI